ncbi:hypothetical protein GGI12_004987 [Dipsacomyces acuminosporus]|nr:hypothetical protein GGI12_004987 [Dipsacomyces acuminosporus]
MSDTVAASPFKALYAACCYFVKLSTVAVLSTIRFIANGPRFYTWDYRAHVTRDIVAYMFSHRPAAGELDLADILFGSTSPSDPVLKMRNGYAIKFAIPAYPLEESLLPNAGVWADKLREVARDSVGVQMPAEYLISDRRVAGDVADSLGAIHTMAPGDKLKEAAQDAADMPAQTECLLPDSKINHGQDSASVIRKAPLVDKTKKAVLHLHGGAYVAGSLRTYRHLHLKLSKSTGMRVYGFEYRLAPDHQYPAQLYDAYCALRHLREIGYKDSDITLSGDSAGGNLVLALWQLTRAQFSAFILLSPRVDVVSKRESWKRNAIIDILPQYNIHDLECSTRKLLAREKRVDRQLLELLNDPFISPIHADLSNMPPTLIQVGTAEVMYDDIYEFAMRAIDQNTTSDGHCKTIDFQVFTGEVMYDDIYEFAMRAIDQNTTSDGHCKTIDFQVFTGGIHVFQAFPFMPNLDRAWEAVQKFTQLL